MDRPATEANRNWQTRKTLIDRVSGDCKSGWQEFHQVYRGFVASVASRAGVASADVDDVSQLIFVEVHRDLTKPDAPCFRERSFGAWLGQKVKWRVGEYHRHRHRREQATDPAELPEASPDEPFDELWNRDWNRQLLERALQSVCEKPRNLLVFQALTIQDMSVEDVCEQFGISRSNADTIKKRVKDKRAPIIREIEAGDL